MNGTDFPTFDAFHRAWTGHDPYPWQVRLADELAAGTVPGLVDVPTGLGKTTVLSIAVWSLAHQVHRGGVRSLPQRIVHVVDRRRIVEDTHSGLAALADLLNADPTGGSSSGTARALQPVRDALSRLAGPWTTPLIVQRVHGEAPDSGAWLRPTGCVVMTMTPHQLVSRLLFRGYDVSPRTRSIHAGLLGLDTLLVVDEPHLSHQALATLDAVARHQDRAPRRIGLPPSQVMLLGATVPAALSVGRSRFGLSDADLANPGVQRRWAAARPVELRPLGAMGDANVSRAIVKEVLAARRQHGPDRRLGVIVNSIAVARAVHAGLFAAGEQAALVTSRMRGTERDRLDLDAPTVVSTQCLEVGVDISFDTLITEACPYDVLVQRLGRLARDGVTMDAACVLFYGVKDGVDAVSDPTKAIYGKESVVASMRFLRSQAHDDVIQLDLATQDRLRADVPAECQIASPRIATFHRGYLTTMATTFPTPVSDVPVAAFITGPDEPEDLDVLVAWRADLGAVETCPPSNAEFVAVPVSAVRLFLSGESKVPALADVERRGSVATAPSGQNIRGRVLLRRDDSWIAITGTGAVRPGANIVMDAAVGGYREGVGWDPGSTVPVSDHSVLAASSARTSPYRRTITFPLSPATLRPFLRDGRKDLDEAGAHSAQQAEEWVEALSRRVLNEALTPQEVTAELSDLGLPEWQISVEPDGRVIASWPNVVETVARREEPQSLDEHETQVSQTATSAARAAGITETICATVGEAGRRHDEGKRSVTFQRYLGNPTPESAWAKSRRGKVANHLDRAHAQDVGHDRAWRHEGLSVRAALASNLDPLTVHLIGSHHGRFRPFLWSSVTEPDQTDQNSARRFRDLNDDWNPWGLAYLEALLRLSDWHASAHPQRKLSPSALAEAPRSPENLETSDQDVPARLLIGLTPSPMTGWFAVAGLLWAAAQLGDDSARVWWREDPVDLGAPMWRSTSPLEDVVTAAVTSSQWDVLAQRDKGLAGNGFSARYQRLAPTPAVTALLQDESTDSLDLALAIAQDALKAETSGLSLALTARANNASYVETARRGRRSADATSIQTVVASLLDPNSGWAQSQCDGGMDRPEPDGGVIGMEPPNQRIIRLDLAPLALLGMAAFGAGGRHGFGVDATGRRCRLPLPDTPVDLHTLGALAQGVSLSRPSQRWLDYTAKTYGKEILWRSTTL